MSFDLDKVIEQKAKNLKLGGKPTKTIDVSKYDNILQYYIEIPKEEWKNIELQTYIRYIGKDGELKKGGKLTKIADTDNGLYLTITNYGNRSKPLIWRVNIDKIYKIYKYNSDNNKNKQSPSNIDDPVLKSKQDILMDQLGDKLLFDNDKELLEQRICKLEAEVQNNHDTIKRLMKLLKIIHQRIS